MELKQKILLLRYSDFHGVDTIKAHKQVIEEQGYCWWAKLGKQPRESYLNELETQDKPCVLLYTSGELYISKLGSVMMTGQPKDHYPAYYKADIFKADNVPSVYFQLMSIEPISLDVLEDYVICSSGKEALYDLKKTISSYMFLQHKSLPLPEKKKRIKKVQTPQKKVNPNSCIYQIDGMCSNRRCINYQYECDRPSRCIKQKVK